MLVRLGSVCTKIGSGITPRGGSSVYKTEGVALIRSQNVLDFSFSSNGLVFVSDDIAEKMKSVEVVPGDVLLNITGDSVARSCLAPEDKLPARVNQHVMIIRADKTKLNPMYLLFVLQHRKDWLLSQSEVGATRKALTKSLVESLEIDLPDIEHQNKISSIFQNLQQLIHVNERINDYLSNIAEAVFTHFQITHKTSECHLSDIAYIVMGQSPPGESYNTEGRGIMFFQGRAEFGQFFPTPNLFTDQPKRLASKGDILISVRAPVGDINIAIADCCIGRGLAAVRSNSGCQAYIHHLIDSIRSNFDQYNGTGTVFGSINKNELNSLTMHIVDSETMKECNSILSEIDAAIKHMHDENELLIKIRMLLMSKFLSST